MLLSVRGSAKGRVGTGHAPSWTGGGALSRITCLTLLFLLLLISLCSCNRRGRLGTTEKAYVAASQVNLRDRLAQMYNKVGLVKNGDVVTVIERQRRFARVRTASGMEGWIEQRYLVGEDVFAGFQKLAMENKGTPAQAQGISRAELNLHLTPVRDSEHLFQLKDGEKLDLIKRAIAEKVQPKPAILKSAATGKQEEAPKPIFEDWWLVRNHEGRTGWVLGRMVDVDIPMEIGQYAEGQRIVAFFILNEVQDEDKKVAQYLTLVTEAKDGLPWDFNQIRIFTWNLRKHRYETAYRERNLFGLLPTRTGFENFDKEGTLPFFVLRVQDDSGKIFEKKYKLNGPIVRRVLSPGEQVASAKPTQSSRTARRRR
jgi:SH3-like domain-containing protein